MTKILITSPIRNSEFSLGRYLQGLVDNVQNAYSLKETRLMEYYFITHNNKDKTELILRDFLDEYFGSLKNMDSDIRMKSDNHDWTTEQVLYLSQLRDECLEKGKKGYDYVYMTDADVILHPKTLSRQIELSKGEHIVHTAILHTHDRWNESKSPCYVNYQYEMAKNGTDLYTGKHVSFDRIVKDFKEATPKEVKVAYMNWIIPVKHLDKLSFYEEGVYEFDFKVFSKKCRDNNIKQIVDFKYPGKHLECSGIVLGYEK